jgi:uncharacterized membrane protein
VARKKLRGNGALVAVPIEVADDSEAAVVAVEEDRPRGRRTRRALGSLGVAGLAWRAAQDERVRDRTRDLYAEIETLVGRRERLRRQRRRKRTATAVIASAGVAAGAVAATRSRGDGRIEDSIVVEVPIATAYNQWTQFEEFPQFMQGVESVEQLDETRLRWAARVAGKRQEWEAKITEQEADHRISWAALSGKGNSGTVIFRPRGPNATELSVSITYPPAGILENVGTRLGLDRRRVRGDLKRFKKLIESRGTESGAWRGRIEGGETRDAS